MAYIQKKDDPMPLPMICGDFDQDGSNFFLVESEEAFTLFSRVFNIVAQNCEHDCGPRQFNMSLKDIYADYYEDEEEHLIPQSLEEVVALMQKKGLQVATVDKMKEMLQQTNIDFDWREWLHQFAPMP